MNRIDAIKVIEDIKSLQAKSELTSDQIEAIHTILHNNTPEVIECAQTVSKVASLNLPEQHYSFLITKLFTTSLMIINNDFDIIFINKFVQIY